MSANLMDKALDIITTLKIVVVVLGLLSVALVVALVFLMPLKELVPVYVEFSSDQNTFVTVKSARQGTKEHRLLADIGLRAYVTMRESVDKITEAERYECINAMSASKVRAEFAKAYYKSPSKAEEKDPDFQTPISRVEGLKRAIKINSDIPINKRGKTLKHQVEFYTIDRIDEGEPVTQLWTALIEYRFTDRKVSLEQLKSSAGPYGAVCNPLGLQIIDYTFGKKGF